MNVELRPTLSSPLLVKVASPYEWDVLERNVKHYTKNQSIIEHVFSMDIEVETLFLVREQNIYRETKTGFPGIRRNELSWIKWMRGDLGSDWDITARPIHRSPVRYNSRAEILQQDWDITAGPIHLSPALTGRYIRACQKSTTLSCCWWCLHVRQSWAELYNRSIISLSPLLTLNQGSVGDYKVPYCTYCCLYLWKKFLQYP